MNERIADLSAKFGEQGDPGLLSFICECPQIGCRAFVRAPLAVYDRVHDDRSLLLVASGHEDACGSIVADLGAYLIVDADERTPDPQRSMHTTA